MKIIRTHYIRIDWIDMDSGIATLVDDSGTDVRSVVMVAGYSKSGIGEPILALTRDVQQS